MLTTPARCVIDESTCEATETSAFGSRSFSSLEPTLQLLDDVVAPLRRLALP